MKSIKCPSKSLLILLFMYSLGGGLSSAQQLDTIGISPVKANPSVEEAVAKAGKRLSLQRVVESLDGQLQSAVHNTRRFEIVARSDLDSVFLEQAFAASGNVDSNDPNASSSFKIRGAKYVLVAGIDDFQDFEESATFEGLGQRATRRVIRFSAVARIFDSTTGSLLETANFQIRNQDLGQSATRASSDGQLSDQLLVGITREMAEKIAVRVVDVIFPARVLAINSPQVTISRGDGTGIKPNEIWEVFALGEELIDPDTGVSYGRDEIMVGKVRIVRVRPQFSTAEIVDDAGIQRGAVLRRLEAN
jgi:hypothetical protein